MSRILMLSVLLSTSACEKDFREVIVEGLPSCDYDEAKGPNGLERSLAIEIGEGDDDDEASRLSRYRANAEGQPPIPVRFRLFERGQLLLRVGACVDSQCERVDWLTSQPIEVTDGATPLTVTLREAIDVECRY